MIERSAVVIVDFETYFTPFSSVSVVDFEQVNATWVVCKLKSSCMHHSVILNEV